MGIPEKADARYSNGAGDDTKVTFISGNQKYTTDQEKGCCQKRGTGYCCLVSLVLGVLILILGVVLLISGQSILSGAILRSMALTEGSDRLASWLNPPVQAHLEGYAFHVENPEEVMQGAKPRLKEVGPFIYKAVTVKDSEDFGTGKSNLVYNEDGETLTYRARKFYFLDEAKSVGNPDKTYITVPNVPYLTGMRKIKNYEGLKKSVGINVLKTGRATPFINITFSGLLWGYEDELPCNSMGRPDGCGPAEGEVDLFAGDDDDDDDWGDDEWKRRKRSVMSENVRERRSVEGGQCEDLRTCDHDAITKDKQAYVDCNCEWGLFRDRNVTLRKPITMNHGIKDLGKKGWVSQYDGSAELGWWQKGSSCDKVGGQDGGTLAPGAKKEDNLEMFIDLMCRKLPLKFEKEVEHAGLKSLRFIPPPNALGSHDDTNTERQNPENKCYCMEGFDCYSSGLLNMAPCKVRPDLPDGAPIALSFPHFYQADEKYQNAVEGLNPEKEKHEFYVDIAPDFGFPLAIRPKFQLNVVINRDPDVPTMSNFADELILPFLWAQDGFSEPSEEMASAIKFGLGAPAKLSLLGGVALIAVGGLMILSVLVWLLVTKRQGAGALTFPTSR